jgi:hypothetical protein
MATIIFKQDALIQSLSSTLAEMTNLKGPSTSGEIKQFRARIIAGEQANHG